MDSSPGHKARPARLEPEPLLSCLETHTTAGRPRNTMSPNEDPQFLSQRLNERSQGA